VGSSAPRPSGSARREHWLALAFFCLLVSSRLPGIREASARLILNVDELELTLSCVDRLLGVPSTSLAWPAGTLQFFALPAIALQGLLAGVLSPSPRGLVGFAAATYSSPWGALSSVRLVVTLISSAGLTSLAYAFAKRTESPALPYAVVFLFAALPVVWCHSHMAMADAVALGLALAAFAAAEWEAGDAGALCSGACLGLALAAKFPSAVLIPLVLARLLEGPSERRRRVLMFGASLVIALLLGCPYLWTDPLRLAKSLAGNLVRGDDPAGLGATLIALARYAGPLLLAALAGIALLALRRRYVLLTGLVLSLGVGILPLARSGYVVDRYYLPVLAVCIVAACAVATDAATQGWFQAARLRWLLLIFPAALLAVVDLRGYQNLTAELLVPQRARIEVAKSVCEKPAGTRVFAPHELLPLVAPCASKVSLSRIARRARENLARGESTLALAGPSLGADFVSVFSSALSEDEQAFAARTTAMSFGKGGKIELHLFGAAPEQARFAVHSEDRAMKALAAGEVDMVARTPVFRAGSRAP